LPRNRKRPRLNKLRLNKLRLNKLRLNKLKNHQKKKLNHKHQPTQSQNKLRQPLKLPVLLELVQLLSPLKI